jgi:hypothetical protein
MSTLETDVQAALNLTLRPDLREWRRFLSTIGPDRLTDAHQGCRVALERLSQSHPGLETMERFLGCCADPVPAHLDSLASGLNIMQEVLVEYQFTYLMEMLLAAAAILSPTVLDYLLHSDYVDLPREAVRDLYRGAPEASEAQAAFLMRLSANLLATLRQS